MCPELGHGWAGSRIWAVLEQMGSNRRCQQEEIGDSWHILGIPGEEEKEMRRGLEQKGQKSKSSIVEVG